MNSRINQIIKEIDTKKQELKEEYDKLMERYDFYIKNGKVIFSEKAKKYNKMFKQSILKYIFSSSVRHLLSIPFIYMMIVPSIILDIFLFFYQNICFRLYKIPLVKRKDYIIFDRRKLGYLNIIQKINCMYCSYVNGLMSYAVEISGRTEKYWCPIKHAQKNKGWHSQQSNFADYGDVETFKKEFNDTECFNKKKENSDS